MGSDTISYFYKQAWSGDEAIALLEQLSGVKFDEVCVAALSNSPEEVETIQQQFQENIVG
jgi:HD-GYP domain-containing protein (c-di-GMP phosphodiesterase class II)